MLFVTDVADRVLPAQAAEQKKQSPAGEIAQPNAAAGEAAPAASEGAAAAGKAKEEL